MKSEGIVIIFSGPSGVGKGSIKEKLLKNPKLNLVYSISTTTRLPREKEKNGKDYFFVDKKEFFKKIKEYKFLEWAKFAKNYYGTEREYVIDNLKKGNNVLLEIETNGAKQIMKKIDRSSFVSIFITPPNFDELRRRLIDRSTEEEKIIRKRMIAAKREIKLSKLYDYVVINDKLEETIKEVEKIIIAEQNK